VDGDEIAGECGGEVFNKMASDDLCGTQGRSEIGAAGVAGMMDCGVLEPLDVGDIVGMAVYVEHVRGNGDWVKEGAGH